MSDRCSLGYLLDYLNVVKVILKYKGSGPRKEISSFKDADRMANSADPAEQFDLCGHCCLGLSVQKLRKIVVDSCFIKNKFQEKCNAASLTYIGYGSIGNSNAWYPQYDFMEKY